MSLTQATYFTLRLTSDAVEILDQRKLPHESSILRVTSVDHLIAAIRDMAVRGAPASGVAGAFGIVLSARQNRHLDLTKMIDAIQNDSAWIREARPTAVNLMWALDRMLKRIEKQPWTDSDELLLELQYEAQAIHDEDIATCKAIGELGKHVIPSGSGVMTCCNTGSLATAGYGTALGVIRSAWAEHGDLHVYACETRPRLQGAKLTAWELKEDLIPFTLITDNMAAWVMKQKKVQCIIAGADRIARNGDTANKIGTYSLATLAKAHNIPFYIAAPVSTIDFASPNGGVIPIEERNASEMTQIDAIQIAPYGIEVYNPAFDVTPAELITGFITELGVYQPEQLEQIR